MPPCVWLCIDFIYMLHKHYVTWVVPAVIEGAVQAENYLWMMWQVSVTIIETCASLACRCMCLTNISLGFLSSRGQPKELIIRGKHYVRCLCGSIVQVGPTGLNSFMEKDGSTIKTIINVVHKQKNPSTCNLKMSCQEMCMWRPCIHDNSSASVWLNPSSAVFARCGSNWKWWCCNFNCCCVCPPICTGRATNLPRSSPNPAARIK